MIPSIWFDPPLEVQYYSLNCWIEMMFLGRFWRYFELGPCKDQVQPKSKGGGSCSANHCNLPRTNIHVYIIIFWFWTHEQVITCLNNPSPTKLSFVWSDPSQEASSRVSSVSFRIRLRLHKERHTTYHDKLKIDSTLVVEFVLGDLGFRPLGVKWTVNL